MKEIFLIVFVVSLCIGGYCLITSEIKSRKRDKKHKRGDTIDFSGVGI